MKDATANGPTGDDVTSKKRTRASKPKVRTGCLTCKIRRVKCDERKPACVRCTSTGRTCDGYDKPAPPRVRLSDRRSTHAYVQAGYSQELTPFAPSAKTVQNVGLRLLRPLVADIPGSSEERRFFHRFRISVASNGLTNHVANQTSFWDEQVPALGHTEEAVKHALVAMSATYQVFVVKRRNHDLDVFREVEIFAIQQYNKAIGQLSKSTIATKSAQAATTSSSSSPPEGNSSEESIKKQGAVGQLENPYRRIEVILMCCLTFISIENLRGNLIGAISHLVNGLRIVETLPFSVLASVRGPPDMTSTPIPSSEVGTSKTNPWGTEIPSIPPSPLLVNILIAFSRLEVSATLFAANIKPIISIRLYAPTQETNTLPPVHTVPASTPSIPSPKDNAGLPPSLFAAPSKPPPALHTAANVGPSRPLKFMNLHHAHVAFCVLAREIYSLAYAVQPFRGDISFWGDTFFSPPEPATPLSVPTHSGTSAVPVPTPPTPDSSTSKPRFPSQSPIIAAGSASASRSPLPYQSSNPSPEAARAQLRILTQRLREIHLAFNPLLVGPSASARGSRAWVGSRLDMIHMRCCTVHLATIMYRHGAGNISEHRLRKPQAGKGRGDPRTTREQIEKNNIAREAMHGRLQPVYEELIQIAEEVGTVWDTSPIGSMTGFQASPQLTGKRYLPPHSKPSHPTATDSSSAATSNTTTPSPVSSPGLPSVATSQSSASIKSTTSPQPRRSPGPTGYKYTHDTDSAQYASDLGIVAPVYLAALHVRSPQLRARAVVLLRKSWPLEGFWDGNMLAELLDRLFTIDEGGARSNGARGRTKDESDHLVGETATNTATATIHGREILENIGSTLIGGTDIPGLLAKLGDMQL